MDLHDLSPVLTATGPFVTVHVESESAVERAADKYDLVWKDALKELEARGVDEATREAVSAARGDHAQGGSRLVVATAADATVRLAVSLPDPPRRSVVDVAPLPHLMPLVDDVTSRLSHLLVQVDRTGADITAYYDASTLVGELSVTGNAPDIRKVASGGWSQLRYQHRAENGWQTNGKEIASGIEQLAARIDAEVIVLAGDEREIGHVREALPTALAGQVLEVPGGRGDDGSAGLVRRRASDAVARVVAQRTLDLLADYSEERGQLKRGVDGVGNVVEALRKAQVETLLVTTGADTEATLWFGPDPTQLGTSKEDLQALGIASPQQGPLVDVLLRAAIGTAADVQLVPAELSDAPASGVGAVLRYADASL